MWLGPIRSPLLQRKHGPTGVCTHNSKPTTQNAEASAASEALGFGAELDSDHLGQIISDDGEFNNVTGFITPDLGS